MSSGVGSQFDGNERLPVALLSGLVEQSNSAICVLDRNGVFIAFSEPFAQLFFRETGTRPAHRCRLADAVAHVPEIGKTYEERWSRVLAGERYAIQTSVPAESGEIGRFDIEFRPILGPDGEVLAAVMEARDVTDAHARAQAEQLLRMSERRFEALFAQSAVGLVHTDEEGRLIVVNDRFCEIVGRSRDDLIGKTFVELTHPFDLPDNLTLHDRLVKAGEPILMEKRYVRPDGGIVWVRVRVQIIAGEDGQPPLHQAIVIDITARIQAEQALRRQLATTTAIADNAASALLLLDRQGRIIKTNPAFGAITGYSKEQTIGSNAHDLLHAVSTGPGPIRPGDAALRAAFQEGTPLRGHEEAFFCADGSTFEAVASFTPILDDDERFGGGVLEFRDVSSEKAAERELRRREERFRFLAEAIPLPIWTTDPKGKVTFANAMLRERHALTLEEIQACRYRERFHPDDRIRMRLEWQRCLQTGMPLSTHCRSLVAGQGYRWHLTVIRPRIVDDKIVEWVGSAIDLNEQIERERALELTAEVARSLSEDLDLDRVMQTLADSAVEATGATGGAFLRLEPESGGLRVRAIAGRPTSAATANEYKKTWDQEILEHLRRVVRLGDITSDDSSFRQTLFRNLPAGRGQFCSFLSVPIGSHGNALHGVVCLVHPLPDRFTDAHESLVCAFASQAAVAIDNAMLYKDQSRLNSELVAARDRALAASRAKSEFLANMSHEVRTPLNGVIGTATMLKEMDLGQEASEMISTILTSSETLLRVIDDVLDLARVEQGHMEIEVAPSDLAAIAANVVATYRESAEERGIDFSYFGPKLGDFLVLADARRLHQVLAHLVTNAIKFTHAGSVQLRLEKHRINGKIRARFRVADTGIGIPPDRLEKVFDSFVQADGSIRRVYGGTGLGLTIAQRLIDLMGGSIHVESEVGKGTAFDVELDFAEYERPKTQEPEEIPAPRQGLRVLLAEDNEVNVLVARRMLERCGCRVDVAEDGLQAIDLAEKHTYDLILMDLQMPNCDGLEAARAIRSNDDRADRPRIPIYALTANAMSADRDASALAGMDGFVAKPVTFRGMRELLSRISADVPVDVAAETPPEVDDTAS